MKYGQWLNEWLDGYVKPSAKPKTYNRYSEIIDGHIKDRLGEFELSELTPIVLQRFASELSARGNLVTGAGLSANSVNGIISVVKNSLKAAHSLSLTETFAAGKIKRPRSDASRVTCFTVGEQRKIERAAVAHCKPKMFGIVLCLYTGLRIGELLALEWSDVDFNDCTISVSKTRFDGKGDGGTFVRLSYDPKTAASARVIPLPKQLLPYLRDIKRKSRSEHIISSDGGALSVRSYQRSFSLFLDRLGVARKGFHALRHTFATRALECGMDVKTLSEVLGHKNAAVTLDRYVHSLAEHKKNMMNMVGKAIERGVFAVGKK